MTVMISEQFAIDVERGVHAVAPAFASAAFAIAASAISRRISVTTRSIVRLRVMSRVTRAASEMTFKDHLILAKRHR
jgi:hypothetical protein